MEFGYWRTKQQCTKCGGEIIMRNLHRFPHELIAECEKCKKKYDVKFIQGRNEE